MRLLLDYRPALRERTGVGEYVHQLARALVQLSEDGAAEGGLTVELFTSSWKDRPDPAAVAELGPVRVVDRRVPVRTLNWAWHRLRWPPAELLAGGRYDVVHSPHPLLLPSRRAARVITIHDLDFLLHPERTREEIRRDYPAFVRRAAHTAELVIVPSAHVGRVAAGLLELDASVVCVCPQGGPGWEPDPAQARGNPGGRYILFLGTLEPRKNVQGLLDAYAALVTRWPQAPPLVLAGHGTPQAERWLEATLRPPLAGHVECRGYVPSHERRALYEGARLLVLPSFDEGFGLPVIEAMSAGIPVVASDRGALPEVCGGAALLVDPDDRGSICAGIERVLREAGLAGRLAERGLARARDFSWRRTAELTFEAYRRALVRRARGAA
ncbi:MAG: glycosyltransferase family 4 protein [Acidobacteria bacterium]|nr:glycosyltransferase family 4 protein [Acidobacteriota bacterium]